MPKPGSPPPKPPLRAPRARTKELPVVGRRLVGRRVVGKEAFVPTLQRPHDQRPHFPLFRFFVITTLIATAVNAADAADRFPYEIIQIGGTTGKQREINQTLEGRVSAGANRNPIGHSGLTSQRVHLLDFSDAPGLEGVLLNLTLEVIAEGSNPNEPVIVQVFRAARSQNQPADSRWPPGWVVRQPVDMGQIAANTPLPQRRVEFPITPNEFSGVLIFINNEGGQSQKRYRIRITRLRRQPVPKDLTPEQMATLRTDRAALFETMATLLEPRNWDNTKGADLLLGRDYDTKLQRPLARVADLTGLGLYTDTALALDALKALPRPRARTALRVLSIAALTVQGNLMRGAGRLREAGAAARRNDLTALEVALDFARSDITLARTAAAKLSDTVFSAEARADAQAFIAVWVAFLRAERTYLGLEDLDAPPAEPPAPTPAPPK